MLNFTSERIIFFHMSELIEKPNNRIDGLMQFARGMVNGENGKLLVEKFRHLTDTITPYETMEVIDELLKEGFSSLQVKASVGKIINVFYKSLDLAPQPEPAEGHFLHYLMLENRAVENIMEEIRTELKRLFSNPSSDKKLIFNSLQTLISSLQEYELHYIKKENILFPYLEKTFPAYRCLQIMWSFHDDFRKSLKTIRALLNDISTPPEIVSREMGTLFFVVFPIIFREERIIFPVALRAIPAKVWDEMLHQSSETGWCYINPPKFDAQESPENPLQDGFINLGTGMLSATQIELMINHLPVDITFIDENDEVRYFSGAKHRIFPRAKAIIGRKVQNCHPPESVHVVNEIVEAFRNGSRDHADFWIEMKGQFIHIRYFAMRDEAGNYKGTIEVSQEVSEIRSLTGQRRLLEWN
jgi:hypothetical protein